MHRPSKSIVLLFFLLFSVGQLAAQRKLPAFINSIAYHWADSVLRTMSVEEKIGQLFMVQVQSGWPQRDLDSLASIISKYHIGGLIVFKGGPIKQAQTINRYQSLAKVPLLVSIDGEWGLSMRMDSTIRFPRQMTLSSMNNDSLIYKMGVEIARQCKRMGIHVNFAPDIDINNNPQNPVISTRSFGEDKFQVSTKALQYMNALQDNHILACGKHFPGHGDTDIDSHLSLPVINKSQHELDTLEIYPFQQLIKNGLSSVMTGHLNIPQIDKEENAPASLSKSIVSGWLKDKLDFQGIIMTDALNMKGVVSSTAKPGDIELKALLAGNDILLMSENVPQAFEKIIKSVEKRKIRQNDLDERVRKILMVKHWVGLNNYTPIDTTNLFLDLNTADAHYLNYQLYEGAITLLENKEQTLPFTNVIQRKIASLEINDTLNNVFQQTLNLFSEVSTYGISKDASAAVLDSIIATLSGYEYVIISLHNTTTKPQLNYGITDAMNKAIDHLSARTKVVVCLFGNAYCLTKLSLNENVKSLIISYEDTYLPQYLTAQALFGAISIRGTMPVSPVLKYPRGKGMALLSAEDVLKYTLPEEIDIDEQCLNKVDSIVLDAIKRKAMPGCQVFASVKGKVIYNKSFGTTTYDSACSVTNDMLYDVASVTKISSTALAAMWLYEKGLLDVHQTISYYLPEYEKTNKATITLDEMMSHRAGLQAWIPFYKQAIGKNGKLMKNYFSSTKHGDYAIQVTDSLFMNVKFSAKIEKQIKDSPLSEKGKYVYSDLGMLILQKIIERQATKKIDVLVRDEFYDPLNLTRLTFNPLDKFEKDEIVPTEIDTIFRKTVIQGFVHDPAAALYGGVAGNAGVFSNAQNMGLLMQMLLNKGMYGGKQFLKEETINYFNAVHFDGNRRGFIFDKPETDVSKASPCCKSASSATFGHQGFTGTCTWADPETEMVYVFLSNRVYPTASNSKLSELNVRTKVQQVFYDCLIK
jgi:beta-glucosidase-like glycosyl hydrolase/CubicO group peptidase (beta-lactamase class C family)